MNRTGRDGDARRHFNLQTFGKLIVLAALMFGFGFAMVPLYKKICEVTGINFLTKADREAAEFAKNTQVDTSRIVTVEFDSNHHGPWRFRPEKRSVDVHPGELVTIDYELLNFNHDYTFYVVIYGWVFLLWWAWVRFFANRRATA